MVMVHNGLNCEPTPGREYHYNFKGANIYPKIYVNTRGKSKGKIEEESGSEDTISHSEIYCDLKDQFFKLYGRENKLDIEDKHS